MSETTTTNEADRQQPDQAWSTLEVSELIDAYWEYVAPALRAEEKDPTTFRPTHQWLSNQGFRGLIYTLRTHHDRTFGEFWADDLGLEEESGYDWRITDEETIELLEAFLESRRSRGNLSESSIETLRYRLARYVRAYAAVNGSEALLQPLQPDGDTPIHEATDAAWAAFDRLNEELDSRTLRRIHEAVDAWYAHLVRRKRVTANPVSGLDEEYTWTRANDGAQPTNPALEPKHVKELYTAANTLSEELLVIALCAWGLRSGEVAALHRSQLVLDVDEGEAPYIQFQERKNGPGEVSVLYGAEVARSRMIELTNQETWNGYLFPSTRAASGHITRQTVLNRFDTLVKRGGLPSKIDGQKPVPQMGRRFWYDAYSATQERLFEQIGEIAEEQGSSSPGVVMRNYLSADRRRELRQTSMRAELASAFDIE